MENKNSFHHLPVRMAVSLFLLPVFQDGGVSSVNAVFNWWYAGLGGLGGWALFFLAAIGANVYIFLDSQARKVSALGWKATSLLPTLLILPTVLFRFSSGETQTSLLNLLEIFFFLGIIGGIVPIAAAIGYAINFTGYSAKEEPPVAVYSPPPAPVVSRPKPAPAPRPAPPLPPTRPHVGAWLVEAAANRNYQLFKGDTRIGRSKQHNDIVLTDKAVSREHILIREENGHFTLYDRGAKTGVHLNGQRMQHPEMLSHGDMIELGDTRLQFVTGK